MKFLKFLLYLTLSVCICWGIIFFGGPSIISKLIKTYYGESLLISNVKISPKLDLSIGRIEFDFSGSKQFSGSTGSLKGLTLRLTTFFSKPTLNLSFGYFNIERLGAVKNGKIAVIFDSPLDLSSPKLVSTSEEFSSTSGLYGGNVEFTGSTNINEKTIEDIDIKIRSIDYRNYPEFSSPIAHFKVNSLKFNLQLRDQFNIAKVLFFKVKSPQKKFNFEKAEFDLRNNFGILDAVGFIDNPNLEINDYSSLADRIGLEANLDRYNEIADIDLQIIRLEIPDIGLSAPVTKISIYNKQNRKELFLDSNIDRLELVVNGQHVAEFPNGSVKIEGNWIGSSPFSSRSKGFASFGSDPNFLINIDTFLESNGVQFFTDCVEISCLLDGSSLDYEIVVDNVRLLGKLKCSQAQCNLRNINHEILTEDTKAFFGAVTNTKIFNPLLLVSLYSQMLSGQSSGDGHTLKLN